MANDLHARGGIPFNFVDGLRIRGVDVTDLDRVFTPAGASLIGVTPVGGLSSTNIQAALAELDSEKAPIDSPSLTGTPTATTAPVGTNTTQLATTEFSRSAVGELAPTKTGGNATGTWGISISGNAATADSATTAGSATSASTATTVAQFDSSTSIATTAFVQRAQGNYQGYLRLSASTVLGWDQVGKFIYVDPTHTVTLPTPVSNNDGRAFHLYTPMSISGCFVTTQAGSIIINDSGAQTRVMGPGQYWTIVSNGVDYVANVTHPNNGIGYGQEWRDMTASRELNTIYTNSTNQPIMVQVRAYTNGTLCRPYVGGLYLAAASLSSTDGFMSVTFIVPPGVVYAFEASSFERWVELR